MDGLQVFHRLKQLDATTPVIILSGEEDLGEILRAVHEGAFDFVAKELTTDALSAAVERARVHVAMVRENVRLSEELRTANADLEQRVAERTAQLVQVNRDLETSLSTLARAQEQLVQAGKLAALGTLVAGVAHELNNPLAYTTNNVEFATQRLLGIVQALEEKHGDGDGLARDTIATQLKTIVVALGEARDGAFRAGHIVRDLKSFARTGDDQSLPVDVEKLLQSSVRLASNEIAHRARLITDFAKVPLIMANELRLGQVFLNLLLNAAQAIAPGTPDENAIRLETRIRADGRVVVTVRDTGAGMAPTTMAKVFDPFFTTKSVGTGMGLGLSICHGIVTKMGGEITVESEVGKGSAFHVVLPPAPPCSSPPLTRASVLPSTIPEQARVLVVDDEPLIGSSIRRGLSGDHSVQVFDSAQKALEALAGGQVFDVILCDLMMPEMTGMQFYERLLVTVPHMAPRVIFATGGILHTSAADFLNRVPNAHIQKPFDLDTLRKRISDVLCSDDGKRRTDHGHSPRRSVPIPP
jgi:signal transduction histidine kinase